LRRLAPRRLRVPFASEEVVMEHDYVIEAIVADPALVITGLWLYLILMTQELRRRLGHIPR